MLWPRLALQSCKWSPLLRNCMPGEWEGVNLQRDGGLLPEVGYIEVGQPDKKCLLHFPLFYLAMCCRLCWNATRCYCSRYSRNAEKTYPFFGHRCEIPLRIKGYQWLFYSPVLTVLAVLGYPTHWHINQGVFCCSFLYIHTHICTSVLPPCHITSYQKTEVCHGALHTVSINK